MSIIEKANELSNVASDVPVEQGQDLQNRLPEVISRAMDIAGPDHPAAQRFGGLGTQALESIGAAVQAMQQLSSEITSTAVAIAQQGI